MIELRLGRPPLPEGEAKAKTFCLRLTAEERGAINAAAKRAGLRPSEWTRAALAAAARRRS